MLEPRPFSVPCLSLHTVLCKCVQEGSTDCTDESLGDFVQLTEIKAKDILGGIVTFLGTINATILSSVDDTIDGLEGIKGDLEG